MKLNATSLAIASEVACSIIWAVCSAFVALMPSAMMRMTGHMIHADLAAMGWTLTWSGFFLGLIAWAIVAGISAWLIAVIYNRLLGQ